MISVPDRRAAVLLIDEAVHAGARCASACRVLGLSVRTYQCWLREGEVKADGRLLAFRPEPANKLTPAERDQLLALCHTPEFASLPPSQSVPRLADRGEYLASEATCYRILRVAGAKQYSGRSRPPRPAAPPPSRCAQRPCPVWSRDITWLPGPVRGQFFCLYLILDLYSRKIVGWEIHDREAAALAAQLVRRAVLAEQCVGQPLVLHADNASPQKGSTLRGTLAALGIEPSYSRHRVIDDNPFSEALFRTYKYRPSYPTRGFDNLAAARYWTWDFVRWYNQEHRHSAFRYVNPAERHAGHDQTLLAQRHQLYQAARAQHPRRRSGATRNWQPIGEVWLNPVKEPSQTGAPLQSAA